MNTKGIVAAVVGVVTFVAVGGTAFATAPDPVAESTGLVTDGVAALGPVIVAIAGAGLGLLVLTMGLRMAYSIVKARGQRAV